MGRRFIYIPNRVIDTNGISDGASIYVYQTGTTTLVSLYSDESLTTPIANPYVVPAGAAVPEIYHDHTGNIRVRVVADGGAVVSDDDPYQAPVTDTDLASTDPGKGAALVSFKQLGAGAVARSVLSKLQERISVFDFMTEAEENDVKDRTELYDHQPAIQAACANLIEKGGGRLWFPEGTYRLDAEITVDRTDANEAIYFEGAGAGTILHQTGTDQRGVVWSTSRILNGSGIKDLKIVCDPTASHCIEIEHGCSYNLFENLVLQQSNPAASIFRADDPAGGIYDCKFSGGTWFCKAGGTSVAGFRVSVTGTLFNENIFENLRCYYSGSEQFFKITMEAGGGAWLVNNRWQNINFEVCRGGGIYIDSAKIYSLKGISFWDSQGAYTGHLIHLANGVGLETTATTMENITRNGDSLAAGIQDIKIDAGSNTEIRNCYTQAADNPRYDFGNKSVTVTGRFIDTNMTNGSGVRMISTGSGTVRFPGSSVYLNNYDEGTWTATLGGVSAPTTPVTATGQWTRIGRMVTVHVVFSNVDTTGASGDMSISGLPFAATIEGRTIGSARMEGFGTDPAVSYAIGSSIWFYKAAAGATRVAHTAAGPGKTLGVSVTYETAA